MQMLGSRQGMGGEGGGDYARSSSGSPGGPPSGGSTSKPAGASKGGAAKFDDMDDDIPF
jgi:single-strand DNA-binding protein